MQFAGGGLELAGRLHALVQNARDLDQPGLGDTVIDHMNRPLHRRLPRDSAARAANESCADRA